jgi:hypothetical protein
LGSDAVHRAASLRGSGRPMHQNPSEALPKPPARKKSGQSRGPPAA